MSFSPKVCNHKKSILIFLSISVLILSLIVAILNYCFHHPYYNSKTVVLIEKGSSLSQITSHLVKNDVLGFPFLFKTYLLCIGEWRELKAGEYLIPPEVTPAQLIKILKSGDVILHPVTVIEGETSHHLTQKLLKDSRFCGPCPVPQEGSLLPETYHFPRDTERQVIINHMQQAMKKTVVKLWAARSNECLLKTPDELVTLASIVEKETALAKERPIIAAVFLNRLKINMMLQADPTVIYGLTKGAELKGRDLTLEDLKVENPFNTYLVTGLPPTPIANPGLLSLKAVIHPRNVPYLYFVADGTGGHVFSTTLEEHQLNHEKWRKIRNGVEMPNDTGKPSS